VSEEYWPESWYELRSGKGCGMCANQGLAGSGWGVRFLQGSCVDVYLWRSGTARGHAVEIWNHDHVAEPTQLPADQLIARGRRWLVGHHLGVAQRSLATRSLVMPSRGPELPAPAP
jgi:hypothetical protein